MSEKVSVNGSLVEAEAAALPLVSKAGLYGKGLFTTIRVTSGAMFLWEKHAARLKRHAEAIGVDLPADFPDSAATDIELLLRENRIQSGKVRITVFDLSPAKLWTTAENGGPMVLIQTARAKAEPGSLKVGISPVSLNSSSPLAGVKSCNYLESLLALEECAARGFDEAIRLNEYGVVASGCLANVFWFSSSRERLVTPPLSTGCVDGTTRSVIMDNFDVEESSSSLEEFLADAAYAFLTSAVKGVAPVRYIDGGRELARPHPLLGELIPAF